MDSKTVVILFILSAIVPQIISITCFVRNTSRNRRETILIVPGRLEMACQVLCLNTAACTAIQITTSGNCVIFGAETTAIDGQCPAPFTCQLRTTTGCVPRARRPIDLGHIRHYCSGAIDRAPADDGTVLPCGTHSPGNRTIYIDALLHDGTNTVLENYNMGHMAWDDGIGSWYMLFRDDPYASARHYFLAAKCVRPAITPISGCHCDPLPMDSPLMLNFQNPSPVDRIGSFPLCSTSYVQMRYLNTFETDYSQRGYFFNPYDRLVFCANFFWITVLENPSNDNSNIVAAASCVTT